MLEFLTTSCISGFPSSHPWRRVNKVARGRCILIHSVYIHRVWLDFPVNSTVMFTIGFYAYIQWATASKARKSRNIYTSAGEGRLPLADFLPYLRLDEAVHCKEYNY